MRVEWEAAGDYDEVGGCEAAQEALRLILTLVPREHLRRLTAIVVADRDPRGVALGIYQQDSVGTAAISLYLQPHLEQAQRVPKAAWGGAFRLELAHTLFHEVGHHVTRCLNRRAAPSRKSAQVHETLEKWAEQYAEKRLVRLAQVLAQEHAGTTRAPASS
ncbi:MAG: hypothetical protein M3Y13_04220 [Armatimonadota bacterium]|nr:hypothetical protein [Armatimonadota bacterium]